MKSIWHGHLTHAMWCLQKVGRLGVGNTPVKYAEICPKMERLQGRELEQIDQGEGLCQEADGAAKNLMVFENLSFKAGKLQ
jgi:hypothetical protein